jgi:hypothetical protein
MRIISGTVVTVVAGFSLAFSYLLYRLAGEFNAARTSFGSTSGFVYLAVEGVFLGSILLAGYVVVRKRN